MLGPRTLDAIVAEALAIAAIPAPTFAEAERGRDVAARLRDAGLAVATDDVGNVTARVGGPGPAVVVTAHLDTVFPADTPLAPRREGTRLLGPGIGDNAVAIAVLLHLARRLAADAADGPVLLAATVGEEGLGDLRGIRRLLEREPAACVIALEGHGVDGLTVAGVGSVRYEARYTGPGGHSWGDRGRPSALHALFRCAQAAIEAAAPAAVNVGVAEGGISVNTIAGEARLEIDIRSEDAAVLETAATRALAALHAVPHGIRADVREVGRRPAGRIERDHPLLLAARRARVAGGLPPAREESASTDANAALARGIPALCVGITRGGGAHRLDEWVEAEPIARSAVAVELLVRAAASELA